ncbi:MAG: hypothetical protein MI922_26770 [Bacteroidales bacterium]|nr:hypothetical protein [Bacteroidales bacterium]
MYDIDKRAYTGKILLKQGFYNYRYIMKAVDEDIDWSLVEGSHAETENNLVVFIYYKEPGYDFERLKGFEIINSTN